jgi:mannosyltransferase
VNSLVRNHWALFTILIVGSCCRIYQLGTESLWLDEGASLGFANMGGPSEIVEQSKTDNNFPTYYLILYYWIALFGDSDFSVRVPSALAGIVAIFVIYKVGYLLFSRNVGIITSLILALSPFHVSLSQVARTNSLMALLALSSFYFFIKLLRREHGRPAAQIGYVLSTSALMYSHIHGVFIVFAQSTYLATVFLRRGFASKDEARQGLGGWILLQVLLVVLYVPGLVLLASWLSNSASQSKVEWLQPPTLNYLYKSVIVYAGNCPLLILLLTLSLLAAVQLIRSGDSDKLYLLLLWFLIPVFLPVAISIFSTPMFATRYAIGATPAFYLLAAKGVEVADSVFSGFRRVPQALKSNTVWPTAVIMLIVLSSVWLWDHFNYLDRAPWREVTQYVNSHAQPNDLILLYPDFDLPVFSHYFQRTDIDIEPVPDTALEEEQGAYLHLDKYDRIWAIEDQERHVQRDRRQPSPVYDRRQRMNKIFPESFVKGPYTSVYYEQYKDIDLTLYEKK